MHWNILFQLLKDVTIASGGVIPKIQPELLAKKQGSKFVQSNGPITIPFKKPTATKPVASKQESGLSSPSSPAPASPLNAPGNKP